jgi:hypothetical protein
MEFRIFHALFSTKLSQLGQAITTFAQDEFRKSVIGAHKTQIIASFSFDYSERCHKDGNCISFLSVETTEEKLWMHTFTKNPEKV